MTTTTPPTTPPMIPQVLPVFEDDESFLTGTADCVTWVPVDVPTEPSALVKVDVKVDVTSLRVTPARREERESVVLGEISSWVATSRLVPHSCSRDQSGPKTKKRSETHCSRPETPPKNQK